MFDLRIFYLWLAILLILAIFAAFYQNKIEKLLKKKYPKFYEETCGYKRLRFFLVWHPSELPKDNEIKRIAPIVRRFYFLILILGILGGISLIAVLFFFSSSI